MLESIASKELNYNRLSPEEQQKRGILGTLVGTIADYKNPTRNGRLYSEKLWDKVFENPVMKEKIQTKTCFGELGHPEDRLEVDMAKIAICLEDFPKKTSKGELVGAFHILDTPNGRILKTLCDYGCNIGVSSRGNGEIIEDFNENKSVDPDTYDCECWDAVLIPAVKSARLKMVESLNTDNGFKKAINESLNKAKPDEKKVMEETLKNLNIEYTHENVIDKEVLKEDIAANNIGANIINDLQESLLKQKTQDTKILELQEKLSVCYAKEAKYEEDIIKYKKAIQNLSESANNAKALKIKIENLDKELKERDNSILNEQIKREKLNQKYEQSFIAQTKLNESISNKQNDLINANSKIKSLNEKIDSLNNNNSILNESIEEVKKNLNIKTTEYNNKLSNINNLIEQYRNTAKTAVNKYIESKATMLGVSDKEIKNKLPSNYSFNDINKICESLSEYRVQISKLPFDLHKDTTKIIVKESKEKSIIPSSKFDDEIDDQLLRLSNLK